MELTAVAGLLSHQSGVISRRQLLDHGARDIDIWRWERRRRLRRVHPGVYVDHTGPLTWEQRTWADVPYLPTDWSSSSTGGSVTSSAATCEVGRRWT